MFDFVSHFLLHHIRYFQTNIVKVGSAGLEDWPTIGSEGKVVVTEGRSVVPKSAVPSPVTLKMMLYF